MSDRHFVEKQGLFESIAAAWSSFRQKMRVRREFAGVGNCEANRMAADFGLSAREVEEMLVDGPDSARQLYRRLAGEGIGVSSVPMEALRDLQRCCGHCDSKPQCDHELEDQPKTASWPKYCPNELTITALKAGSCH